MPVEHTTQQRVLLESYHAVVHCALHQCSGSSTVLHNRTATLLAVAAATATKCAKGHYRLLLGLAWLLSSGHLVLNKPGSAARLQCMQCYAMVHGDDE
jgi:hypothetical protein